MLVRLFLIFFVLTINALAQNHSEAQVNVIFNQNRLQYMLLLDSKCESIKNYIDKHFVLPDTLAYRTIQQIDRKNIKDVWAQCIDIYLTLEKLNQQFKKEIKTYKKNELIEVLMFATYAMSYDLGLHVIEKTLNKSHYEVLLDEAQPEYGIKAGQYNNLKFQIIHSNYLSSMTDEFDKVIKTLEKHQDINPNILRIKTSLENKCNYIKRMRKNFGTVYFLKNTADFFTDLQQNMFLPLQKESLKLIGDTRLTSRHGGLISNQQCDSLINILQPGDILFERKEWYLSNIGLPGFWPHSAIYIGNREQLSEWSEDDELFNFYNSKYPEFVDFPTYLERKYPNAWKKYIETDGNTEPMCIIEAIGEGVVFHNIYQSAGSSDYFAALRPKLSKKDIAQALELAFSFFGRDYDYNFDFLSDYELVCSELIYKCYEADINKEGLNFGLEYIMGRLTLPPNSMIAQFCKDTASSKLSFAVFMDANEEKEIAFRGNYETFKYSYKRPRWGYNEADFLEELKSGKIDSIYTIHSKTKYFLMPLNMSVFFNKSVGNVLSDGKEIINYVSINFLSGKAARLRGVEIGLLWNFCSEYMTGVQIAGVINTVIEDSYGFQISGLFNINASDFYGVQASGLANFVGNSMVGCQLSLLSNSCEKLYGVQLAPLVNTTLDKSLGVQISMVNISMNMKNTQIGIFNTAGDMSGFQFGFANGAYNMKKGLQFGLFNITKKNKGYPIGLFSYVNEHLPHYQIWFDEIPSVNLAVKSGTEKFYNLLSYGKFLNTELSHSLSWGLGFNYKYEDFSFSIGPNIRHIFNSNENFWKLNDILQLKLEINYRIWNQLNFTIAPTYNYFISKSSIADYINIPELSSGYQKSIYTKSWIGLGVGLSY